MKKRLVIFISGSGTNLQAILDACADGRLNAEPVLVVSNRVDAYGLVRAERAGVATLVYSLRAFKEAGQTRVDYEASLVRKIRPFQPDLIILAGWMHILGEDFLNEFPNQIINLHPALPGQFAGTRAIERAFAAYQAGKITESGCMIHYVIPEVDAGEVIMQTAVPIHPSDTLDTFAQRMHAAEHALIVAATAKLTNIE